MKLHKKFDIPDWLSQHLNNYSIFWVGARYDYRIFEAIKKYGEPTWIETIDGKLIKCLVFGFNSRSIYFLRKDYLLPETERYELIIFHKPENLDAVKFQLRNFKDYEIPNNN